MHLTQAKIQKYYSISTYQKGLNYMKAGKVETIKKHGGAELVNGEIVTYQIATVIGSQKYKVTFPLFDYHLTKSSLDEAICNCFYFTQGFGDCKHIVAAILEFANENSKEKSEVKGPKPSNNSGLELLQNYLTAQTTITAIGNITLKPNFFDLDANYPNISFTVGKDKMYVVKKIDNFLDSVKNEDEISYGKGLTFIHTLNQFDEMSRLLLPILSNINEKKAIIPVTNNYNNYYSYSSYNSTDKSHLSHSRRCINMDGNSFELFFDLYLGTEISVDKWKYKNLILSEGDPEISITIKKSGKGATLTIDDDENLRYYGNTNKLYIIFHNIMYKCSETFTKKIFPILKMLDNEIYIGENDLPTLCSMVLPVVKDIITIEDKSNLCDKYTPDDCMPCFYFDIADNGDVISTLKFKYGELEVDEIPSKTQLTAIKQNAKKEELAKNFLKQYFTYETSINRHILSVDEDTFLTQEINNFSQQGEVFLSSRIRGKFVSTKTKPTLGVSVSNGLLNLEIDTGEFPAEELELLYNSFLKKQKYHKLKDGRLLFLEGSGYEKIAEVSHMLQLNTKELKSKNVVLPAYRGLYLDSVLDKNENITIKKNKDFRHMMKDFKAVSDSDYQPSELLNAELSPYQVLGFQWLKTLEQYNFGGILADEMGLGKTIQTITFLLSIEQKELPSIVICPASLLFNWRDELQRFAPTLNVMLLIGTAKERKAQIESKEGKKADVWVTSYDLIKRDREHYENKKFYACILDEAQNIKNKTTLVSETVKKINSKQRFVLTGTPIENKLSELWNLFDFLMPNYLFTHNAFVSKLEKPIVSSEETLARQQLNLLVKPFILRRLKKDVLQELPDKMEHIRKILLSEDERKIYIAAATKIKEQTINTTNKLQILAQLTHLRQLCCDPNLCFDNYEGDSSKLEACIELCQTMVANGHKILLFSQFTSMLDIIRARLNDSEITHLTIEGKTTKDKRAKYVKQFQNGEADVFLISLKAGGTGLNLTLADVVIHYDPWWNQAAQNQATDRAHRIGQEQHVQVYKLIAQGTIEEKILELQEKKASLMETVLQESGDEPLSTDDIMALLD